MSAFTTQLTTDLAEAFFDTDTFAEDVTYTASGGSPTTIPVIWDAPFDLLTAQEIGFQSLSVVVQARTSDVSAAKTGDTIVRSGTTYYVRAVRPDGQGVTALGLSKA